MTTTTTEDPTVLAASIIEHITAAVGSSATADEARKALNDIINSQESVAAEAAAEAEAEAEAARASALTIDEKFVLRPNGEQYWVRKLGNHSDIAALRAARDKGMPVLAYGPPGTGKTALFEAAFPNLHVVQGTGDTDSADFVGGYTPLPGGEFMWVDGPLLKAMENGEPLMIDEVALIDPKALAIVYAAMDGRGEVSVTANPERGVVKAKPGFYVVAACNPNAPGARLSEAIVSRFVLQFEVGTDYALCKKLGVDPKMVTAAQNMQRKVENGELGWAPQTREMLAFRDIHETFGLKFALNNMVAASPEIDRAEIADILGRTFGDGEITGLQIA